MNVVVCVRRIFNEREFTDSLNKRTRAMDITISWGEQYVNFDGQDAVKEQSLVVSLYGEKIDEFKAAGIREGSYIEANLNFKLRQRGEYMNNIVSLQSAKPYNYQQQYTAPAQTVQPQVAQQPYSQPFPETPQQPGYPG